MNKMIKSLRHWWLLALIFPVITSCFLHAGSGLAIADSDFTIWQQQEERLEDVEGYITDVEFEELVDITQAQASDVLLSAAQWFDSFFDNPRYVAEENRTRAKVRLETSYHTEDGFDVSPSIRWRIHLPKLEEKLNLLIFASDDPDDPIENTIASNTGTTKAANSDFAAALQYFIKTTEKYNISASLGGSFDYLYGGLRYRYFKNLGKWQTRFIERVRYYTDDGWENYNSLDVEREFLEKYLYRNTATLYIRENDDSLDQTFSFILYQFINDTRALAYEWINNFETDPSYRLSDLILRLRYRQQGHREWLLYEISPWVNFPEDDDYNAQFGLLFTLEAKFGYSESTKLKNIFQF